MEFPEDYIYPAKIANTNLAGILLETSNSTTVIQVEF